MVLSCIFQEPVSAHLEYGMCLFQHMQKIKMITKNQVVEDGCARKIYRLMALEIKGMEIAIFSCYINIMDNKKFKIYQCLGMLFFFLFLVLKPGTGFGNDSKVLRVGVPTGFPPFSFKAKGEYRVRGYAVDVITTISDINKKNVRFLVGNPEDLLAALRFGEIDVVSGIVLSEKLKQDFDFLELSVFVKRFFYVKKAKINSIKQDDLPGKTVVVVRGQPYMDLGLDWQDLTIVQARSLLEALQMLNNNHAQIMIGTSERVVNYLVEKHGLTDIRQVGVTMGRLPLAIIVSKGNTMLLKQLSVGLGMAISDGRLGKVEAKWFSSRDLAFVWSQYKIYLLSGAFFLLILMIGFIIWNYMLKSQVTRITRDLHISEQRYRELIESSPDMVFLINPQGYIHLANNTAYERLSIDRDCEKKPHLTSIVDPPCIQAMTSFLKMLFKTGYGSNETRLISHDSRLIRVEMIAATIRLGSEGEQLACCFARDITERKRLEEELVQSEKLAIIGKMSACLAHEINNPIGIVLAHTEDIISGELNPEEVNESLHSIQRNTIRAGQITESLLTQASFKDNAFKNLDLTDALEVCIHFIKPKLKNISIHKDLSSRQYFVYGDEISLQQAFINLLLNAIESIPGTGDKINVQIEHKTIEGQLFVEVLIKDTGKGIAKKDIKKIFDPFFTNGKHRGFGIGLFVAYHIIKKHGGKIIPISVEKAGTVMHVRLPAAKKE